MFTFKDKKAREAIEQLRSHLGYYLTNWNGGFKTYEPGDGSFGEYDNDLITLDDKLDTLLQHLGLNIVDGKVVAKPKPKKRHAKAKDKKINWYDSTPFDTPVKKKRGRPSKSK